MQKLLTIAQIAKQLNLSKSGARYIIDKYKLQRYFGKTLTIWPDRKFYKTCYLYDINLIEQLTKNGKIKAITKKNS